MTNQLKPPFVTWHGYDLPLCPPDQQAWPALPLADICKTLAHIPRFNAAQCAVLAPKDRAHIDPRIAHAWSVAQHLLLCGLLAEALADPQPPRILAALVHDMHEAFIGDITTPVAQALGDNAIARLNKLKLDVDHQLMRHRGTPHAIGLQALHHGGHAVATAIIDRLALVIERAAFIDWAAPRNGNWFDRYGSDTVSQTDALLRMAGSQDFARLRAYTPISAAHELERVITQFATRCAAATVDAEAGSATANVAHHPV